MVELSKFGISNFILQYTLLGMQLLIHAGMAVDRSEVGLVVALVGSLTHLHMDKMATISQTVFSDTFSLIKVVIFWLKFD